MLYFLAMKNVSLCSQLVIAGPVVPGKQCELGKNK